MRLIDAELLEEKTKLAINVMKLTAKIFGISDEEDTKALVEAYETFLDAVKDSPAVEADGWIPVEEKLPDKYGWYLCTLKDGRVNCYYWNNKGEWLDNGKKHFFELYYVYSKLTGMEVLAKNDGSVYWTDWVIAWRPLPKPYKPKEDK